MKKWISFLSLLSIQLPLLAADEAPPPPDAGMWQPLILVGIMIVFFYFILYRPEQKRRQAADAQRAQIKKGDRVVAMGIIGTVMRVQDNSIILKTGDSKIEVLKAAVSDVSQGSEEDARKAEKEDKFDSKKIENFDQ